MMTETTMTEEEGAGATAIGDQGAEVEVEVHDVGHTQGVQQGDQGGQEAGADLQRGKKGLTAGLEAGVHHMIGNMMIGHAADHRLAVLTVAKMTGMTEKLHQWIDHLFIFVSILLDILIHDLHSQPCKLS